MPFQELMEERFQQMKEFVFKEYCIKVGPAYLLVIKTWSLINWNFVTKWILSEMRWVWLKFPVHDLKFTWKSSIDKIKCNHNDPKHFYWISMSSLIVYFIGINYRHLYCRYPIRIDCSWRMCSLLAPCPSNECGLIVCRSQQLPWHQGPYLHIYSMIQCYPYRAWGCGACQKYFLSLKLSVK
jgi:hypothetical protein